MAGRAWTLSAETMKSTVLAVDTFAMMCPTRRRPGGTAPWLRPRRFHPPPLLRGRQTTETPAGRTASPSPAALSTPDSVRRRATSRAPPQRQVGVLWAEKATVATQWLEALPTQDHESGSASQEAVVRMKLKAIPKSPMANAKPVKIWESRPPSPGGF